MLEEIKQKNQEAIEVEIFKVSSKIIGLGFKKRKENNHDKVSHKKFTKGNEEITIQKFSDEEEFNLYYNKKYGKNINIEVNKFSCVKAEDLEEVLKIIKEKNL
jgi:hypothetical protein